MSVHDAQPGDVYVDAGGKLWRCVGTCQEPTAIFEEIEPRHFNLALERKSGGVGGLMWNGWKRIWRKE